MKRLFVQTCLLAGLLMAGCVDSTSNQSIEQTELEPAPVIRLTAEEEAILDTSGVMEEAEPVTSENYEEALDQLEQAIMAEQ